MTPMSPPMGSTHFFSAQIHGVFAGVLQSAKLNLTYPISVSMWLVADEPCASHQAPQSCSPGPVPIRGNSPELRISQDTTSPIDIISSLPPIISPEPWIPLSFLAPEKLQVQISDDDVSDLDMRSCVLRYEYDRSQAHTSVLVGCGL